MGLNHPLDLDDWHRWQRGRRGLSSRFTAAVRAARRHEPPGVLTSGGPRPRLLIALEARKGTTLKAQLAALEHLPCADVGVLAPTPVRDLLPDHPWKEVRGSLSELARSAITPDSVVLSTGHYLPVGAAALAAMADPARFVTVQHGLLTPHTPPLAPSTTLLAWSTRDGDFWRSGRRDVAVRVVGSQLLWDAASSRPGPSSSGPRAQPATDSPGLLYLGQLHGSELPRAVLAEAAASFCREHRASYRPHPSETDRASVATHAEWEADGIDIDRRAIPLRELDTPVVSVYSTGILEAAARGVPAWGHLPNPPDWLRQFWARYDINQWAQAATPAPTRPGVEPARAVAASLLDLLGERP